MARLLPGAAALATILAVCTQPARAQDSVTLEFDGGRVTIVAKDAPLSRVLAEWQRLGGTRFVNAERLPGTPVTLTLTDVPERQALAVLLRPYSGYMASPVSEPKPASSVLRVVMVMPTLAKATPASSPAPAAYQPPAQPRPMNRGFGRPGIQIGGDPDDTNDPDMGVDPQDVQEAPQPGMMGMPNYPGMPTAPPQDPTDPAAAVPVQGRPPVFPGVPGTATVPGMAVPATPPPGSGPPKLPKPPGRDFPPAGTRP